MMIIDLIIGFVVVFSCLFLIIGIIVVYYTVEDTRRDSDVILVLGAKSYHNNAYNPCLVSRVEHALSLYRENYAKQMILSGGNDSEDGHNEAQTMQEIALSKGVIQSAILLEQSAKSTYENITLSKEIMAQKNFETVLIVSEPFQIARAVLVARTNGMQASYSSAADSECWGRWKYVSRYFLREPVAIMWYIITGKINPVYLFI